METLREFSTVMASVGSQKDAVVIVLACSREADGERVPLVDAQKEAAMNAAKATLQCLGADVSACSTAFLFPAVELQENEALTLKVDAALQKSVMES